MASDLTGFAGNSNTLSVGLSLKPYKSGAGGYPSPQDNLAQAWKWLLAFGAGAGQVNQYFAGHRQIAGGAVDDLNLIGTLANNLGGTLNLASVKAIVVINQSAGMTGTPSIALGAAAATPFYGPFGSATDKRIIAAGDIEVATCQGAGWAVSSGAKILRVANLDSVNPALYDILIAGVST